MECRAVRGSADRAAYPPEGATRAHEFTGPGHAAGPGALRPLLDDMHNLPAMILHRRTDILTWNRAAAARCQWTSVLLPPHERNCIRLVFLPDGFRSLSAD
ncbi:hypothetical protein ABZ755_13675 [Streptomyces griseoincarnatus]